MTIGPSPDFNDITVEWGPYVYLDGSLPTGTLSLTYSGGEMLDAGTPPDRSVRISPNGTRKIDIGSISIDVGGQSQRFAFASFTVPASNDPDIQGGGGTYTVTPVLTNGKARAVTFFADIGTPDGVIRLNDVTPTDPTVGTPIGVITYAEIAAAYVASTSIRQIVRLAQAEYDALDTPDPNTLYVTG